MPGFAWMSPLGTATGDPTTFDAAAAPVVEICTWNGVACSAPPLVRFATTGGAGFGELVVNAGQGRYEATWNLLDATLVTRKTYRIRVIKGSTEISHVLVDAVRGRWALTRTDGTLAPLAAASSLPIRFWVRVEGEPVAVSAIQVTLDRARGASATVGPQGGTIAAEGADGARFQLVIPPDALAGNHTISLTPAASVTGMRPGAQPLGTVHFEPEGLQFRRPATLTITLPTIPSPDRLTAFGYHGIGDAFHFRPFTRQGNQLTITVWHFSGAGASLDECLSAISPNVSIQERSEGDIACILASGASAGESEAMIYAVFARWYLDGVKLLANAATACANNPGCTNPEVGATTAVNEFVRWKTALDLYGFDGRFASEEATTRAALFDAITKNVAKLDAVCVAKPDIRDKAAFLPQYYYWLGQSQLLEGSDAADLELVCGGAMARIAFEITVSPTPATVEIGETIALTATVKNALGGVITDRQPTWSLALASSGIVALTADHGVLGIGRGTTLVNATMDNVVGSAMVTVPAVTSLTLDKTSLTLGIGQTETVRATARTQSGATLRASAILWQSDKPLIAEVTAGANGGAITGRANGDAVVEARVDGLKAQTAVRVTSGVASVAVSPDSTTILRTHTLQLSATAKDASGQVMTDAPVVVWTSDNPSIASVTASGLVSGASLGTATIRATSDGVVGVARVVVTDVGWLAVAPAAVALPLDMAGRLTAAARGTFGEVLFGRTAIWRTSDPAIVSVSASGVLTPFRVGSAVITVILGGRTATAEVTVTAAGSAMVEDLGSLAQRGEVWSEGQRINELNEVLGFSRRGPCSGSSCTGGFSGFYYVDSLGVVDPSPTLSKNSSSIALRALNDRGSVTGNLGSNEVAFDMTRGVRFVAPLAGSLAHPVAINNAGQVMFRNGVRFTPGVGYVQLPAPLGGFSDVWDMNQSGQTINDDLPPARYSDGLGWETIAFSRLIDGKVEAMQFEAWMIDNAGSVVGRGSRGGYVCAYRWTNGVVTDLGPCPAPLFPRGVNDLGNVVGSYYDTNRAGYYDGTWIDLNTLIDPSSGWVLVIAEDINNSRRIVGTGTRNGQTRAFRLTLR